MRYARSKTWRLSIFCTHCICKTTRLVCVFSCEGLKAWIVFLGAVAHLWTHFLKERIENLEQCTSLKYLDLSGNLLLSIENLSSLTRLETLIVSKNLLSKARDLCEIVRLHKLRELDVSSNKVSTSDRHESLSTRDIHTAAHHPSS